MTAVTHGWLFVHWTAIWAKSEPLTQAPLSIVQSKRKYTRLHSWTLYYTLLRWYMMSSHDVGGWNLIGMAIQLKHSTKVETKGRNLAKCTTNKFYDHIQSYCHNCSTLPGKEELPGGHAVKMLPEHLENGLLQIWSLHVGGAGLLLESCNGWNTLKDT